MAFSFWEQNTFIKKPDVVVIGSGIVGLNAALEIKRKSPKLHILVLERGMLPYGASTRNAGFACYGSPSELLEDLDKHSEDDVFSLVEKRWKGLQRLRKILGDTAIVYEPFGGYEVFSKEENNLYQQCVALLPLLNKHLFAITGQKAIYHQADDKIATFGFNTIEHIIGNSGEGQIDTGRMMNALMEKSRSAGIEILNGANVERFEEDGKEVSVVLSDKNSNTTINCRRLLICTDGFSKKLLPDYDVNPARSQVLITSPIKNLRVKGSFHYDHGYYYFRNVGDRILFGGGRNLDFKTEFTDDFSLTEKIQSRLDELLRSMIIPSENYTVEMRWSGIMGLGTSKSPIIKPTGQNIYCAIRLGGMGIAIGSLVGEEAANLILNSLAVD